MKKSTIIEIQFWPLLDTIYIGRQRANGAIYGHSYKAANWRRLIDTLKHTPGEYGQNAVGPLWRRTWNK